MKILTIHADFIEFTAKKRAFKQAEEGITMEKQRVEECLVVLSAVEKRDEADIQPVVQRYIQEIKNIAVQVNTKSVVLYPYAHLSSQLSSPAVAEKLMKDAEEQLKQQKYHVHRAPFGWYKSFTLACKGHPLSELSREFGPGEKETTLKREAQDEPFQYQDRKLTKEETLNLSAAFILAKAVAMLYPKAKVGSLGLYQEQAYVDISDVRLQNDDLPKLEKQMKKIVQASLPLAQTTREQVQSEWQRQILHDIGQEKSAYELDSLVVVPLYPHPFVASTKEVAAFKILNLASAYWKGNENNPQLVRIYCAGFPSEQRLAEFKEAREQAENRSHLKIGREQNLFVISELVGAGMPLLAPKGMVLKNEITAFLWQLHKNKGYQQVGIPHIAKDLLYKKSGHWEKFGDELFHVKGKYEQFVLKPMNCPHHIQIFDSFSLSYRDLPVRFFEATTVYRDEKPGQLLGMARVRSITQDDGHIFCRISQIEQEVKTIVGIILQFYRAFGMDKDYWVSFSVRGEDKTKYLGSDEAWVIAEKSLERAAKESKLPYKRIEGEAAFYGPKLDFIFKDALGREWQLATIQCDFNLPERFELGFMNENSLKERPVMIHRAISGSLERFMSILIEHYAGKFPLWLSPVQVKLLTVADRHLPFAQDVYEQLRAQDVRVEVNDKKETIGRKVRDALQEHVPYIVTIGDKEIEQGTLAVRDRLEKTADILREDFVKKVVDEIKQKK